MTVRHDTITYQADGLNMVSHFYCDDALSGPRPGILVFPEAFGLGDHAKARAKQLAGLGYAALACDLHGDGKIIPALPDVMPIIHALRDNPLLIRARAQGGFDALTARPEVDKAKIAAIGYCFGGTMALELARGGAPLAGVVGFHSGLATTRPEEAKNIRAKILVCIGADDPGVPLEQRTAFEQEMRAGGVDWRMHVYGKVVHSFTNREAASLGMPDFARYDAGADNRSWHEMIALFDEVFA